MTFPPLFVIILAGFFLYDVSVRAFVRRFSFLISVVIGSYIIGENGFVGATLWIIFIMGKNSQLFQKAP